MNPRRSNRGWSKTFIALLFFAAIIGLQGLFIFSLHNERAPSEESEDSALLRKTVKALNRTLSEVLQGIDRAEREITHLGTTSVIKQAPSREPTPQASVGLPSAEAKEKKFLVIGIPTVPRRAKYLEQTIDTIARQLPSTPADPLFHKILVIVCNNRPKMHDEFAAVRLKIEQSSLAPYFHFIERTNPDPLAYKKDPGTPNLPGFKVRQQTMDVTTLLTEAAGLGYHYLFMEDDFALCPNGLQALAYLIRKAYMIHSNWFAIRTGYGLNGIILHGEDLEEMKGYYLSRYEARPPDHLMSEWTLKETARAREYLGCQSDRKYICYRHNLFDHLGTVSSLRSSASPSYPRCYDPLGEPTLFQNEAFKFDMCGHDDITPCQPKDRITIPAVNWKGRN